MQRKTNVRPSTDNHFSWTEDDIKWVVVPSAEISPNPDPTPEPDEPGPEQAPGLVPTAPAPTAVNWGS